MSKQTRRWFLFAQLLTLAAVIVVGLVVPGCAAPVDRDWRVQSWREQFPGRPAGCVTLWVVSSWGCAVADESGVPQQCVASEDPFILRSTSKPDGELCAYGVNYGCDCSNQVVTQ